MCGGSGRHGRASQAGFTLVEMVVAFTVVALALAALLPAFSGGLKSIQSADTYMHAVLLARSTADQVGQEIPLRDGDYSGSAENGFDWRVSIRIPETARQDRDKPASEIVSFDVEIAILKNGVEQVRLETLRIAPLE